MSDGSPPKVVGCAVLRAKVGVASSRSDLSCYHQPLFSDTLDIPLSLEETRVSIIPIFGGRQQTVSIQSHLNPWRI